MRSGLIICQPIQDLTDIRKLPAQVPQTRGLRRCFALQNELIVLRPGLS
jgi:hypothetical protein